LAKIVRASAALPFYFPAVRWHAEPVVLLDLVRGVFNWNLKGSLPSHLLLVDGGVRDNLGVEWLDVHRPWLTRVIVISASANRIDARARNIGLPLLGELISLMLVRALPYHIREQNRRRELLRRFLPSYEGLGKADLAGVLIHIEDNPLRFARAVRAACDGASPEDRKVAEALTRNPDYGAIRNRADEVIALLEKAEDEQTVRALIAKRARGVMSGIQNMRPGSLGEAVIRSYAIEDEWGERALRNASLSTSLSKIGRETAAGLIRHAFAVAMAKLHVIYEYPLCQLPSIEEINGLMDAYTSLQRH
jgi:hypothetical protein